MGNDYVQLISFLQMKHGEQVHDYSCFAFSWFLQWLDFLYGDKYLWNLQFCNRRDALKAVELTEEVASG